jgi:hypothetical protein
VAREAQAGLWANAAYATRSVTDAGKLLRYRNSYQIVEGSVVHVKAAKTRTYLDFGPDWRTDFSAGVDAKILRANPEWAKTLGLLCRHVWTGIRIAEGFIDLGRTKSPAGRHYPGVHK